MEKEKNIEFQAGMSPQNREEVLKGMATKTDSTRVRRYYTPEEMTQHKDFVAEESINLMDKTEEFKKIQKEFNTAVKTAKESVTDALKGIKRGYSDNEETVYLIDDQESGEMHIYDKNGIYLSSRPLWPEERQTKMYSLPKTGTEG